MFARFRQLNNPSNLLILSLALVDIGMITLCFPLTIWASLVGKWTFGSKGCNYYGFISMLSGISVIGILTLMAIDRYVVICRKTIAANLNVKHYGAALIVVAVNASFWAIMPNLGWSRYDIEPSGISCAVDYHNNDIYYVSYIVALFAVCFVVPLTVMVTCYWMAQSVMSKRVEMGAMLVFLFLLSWSLIAVVCLWAVFGEPSNVPYPLVLIAPLAAKSSMVLNPLVVTAMIGKFRTHVAMMFKYQPEVTSLSGNASQLISDVEKEL
ncbi:putative visual pigment-like receptor peropsin [Apostichopus japonicus]|uniref:Putative visual pigment-like receptor peropsin n=1 Tax=Stichopus japonicus TaxID=307972 RepID=A0A2G8L130_STIJA|nr:putative visual pigment-like receptor peropsin [Apostichopus japonicus]